MRIIEVILEAVHHTEAKLADTFSKVKLLVVEANVHTKANTRVTIFKVISTKVIVVNMLTHE